MNKLNIDNCKAFISPLSYECSDKTNILVYGENGSGKSSIYEAVKLFYFHERLFKEKILPNVVGEERNIQKQHIIDSYKRDITKNLTIQIDGVDLFNYNSTNEEVYLISYRNLNDTTEINIKTIVKDLYILTPGLSYPIESEDFYKLLIPEVNHCLEDDFLLKDVALNLVDNSGVCSLKNTDNEISRVSELSDYFNEAIIHVVRLVIIIEIISFCHNNNSNAIMLLDDCFNSLDSPNRIFMMKYLLRKTEGIQKIVFTHNTGFYNLFQYIINNCMDFTEKCEGIQLSCIDGTRKFINVGEQTTQNIKDNLSSMTAAQIGNRLRQRFEVLVFKLARLNNIGELQEVRDLLDRICRPDCDIYLSYKDGKLKTVYDLVKEIYTIVKNDLPVDVRQIVLNKIENFREHNFLESLRPSLKNLRLLQKVALHQASHGHAGLPPITDKEIHVALALLEKMERTIQMLNKREDVSSI